MVTAMYQEIREEAKRDVAHWGNPGDPDRGYQQLISEQLPIRRQQLYEQYGPGGAVPLIPGRAGVLLGKVPSCARPSQRAQQEPTPSAPLPFP